MAVLKWTTAPKWVEIMSKQKKENRNRKRKQPIPAPIIIPTKKQREKESPFAWNETIRKLYGDEDQDGNS